MCDQNVSAPGKSLETRVRDGNHPRTIVRVDHNNDAYVHNKLGAADTHVLADSWTTIEGSLLTNNVNKNFGVGDHSMRVTQSGCYNVCFHAQSRPLTFVAIDVRVGISVNGASPTCWSMAVFSKPSEDSAITATADFCGVLCLKCNDVLTLATYQESDSGETWRQNNGHWTLSKLSCDPPTVAESSHPLVCSNGNNDCNCNCNCG